MTLSWGWGPQCEQIRVGSNSEYGTIPNYLVFENFMNSTIWSKLFEYQILKIEL